MLEILGERRKSDFRSISFLIFTSIMEQNKKRGPNSSMRIPILKVSITQSKKSRTIPLKDS